MKVARVGATKNTVHTKSNAGDSGRQPAKSKDVEIKELRKSTAKSVILPAVTVVTPERIPSDSDSDPDPVRWAPRRKLKGLLAA